uniref:Uncharacterized protein n=1 Tax=Arundo donax TaxID=35708 RepID=A0A0A8ZJY2_ARUDO
MSGSGRCGQDPDDGEAHKRRPSWPRAHVTDLPGERSRSCGLKVAVVDSGRGWDHRS